MSRLVQPWKPTVASLQKKSAAVVSVFTKAINDAKKINEEIALHVQQKNEQIAALQSEVSTLTVTSDGNAKLTAKIEAFLTE